MEWLPFLFRDTADTSSTEPVGTVRTEAQTCPLCGAPMVLRTACYGKNKVNKFWGYSAYCKTQCRSIIASV